MRWPSTGLVALALSAVLSWVVWAPAWAQAPALTQANRYHSGVDLDAYWVSEKLDGMRAYWDGEKLLSRGGHPIHAPAWFTQGWPAEPADGELWSGRGGFQQAVSTVRRQTPDDAAWRQIRFMVFDLPSNPGDFTQRIAAYRLWVVQRQQPWVQPVEQTRVPSHAALLRQLLEMDRAGGEGLMLHRGDALYRAERSDNLLKLKTHEDAEAQVIGHTAGRGKYAGMTGALRVRSADGREFRIGSGLSDALRRDPPSVGTWITYRYRGLNDSGLPRFATWLRVRTDQHWQPLAGASTPASTGNPLPAAAPR
jgi:DNA ligase-1